MVMQSEPQDLDAPVDPVLIDSVVCACCEQRVVPDAVPRFPESYVCRTCLAWLRLFHLDPGTAGTATICGPAQSIRKVLTGQPISPAEQRADQSPAVTINVPRETADAWNALIYAPAGDDRPRGHLAAVR
jgi:hypothetical protein